MSGHALGLVRRARRHPAGDPAHGGFGVAWVVLEAVVGARMQGHYHLMQVVWCRYAVHLATLGAAVWLAAARPAVATASARRIS